MVSPEIRSLYTPTIGIECHVQLKTATKLFAAVKNDARDAAPNTLVSHICLGMPGALPVLNGHAVKLAIKAAFALGVAPQNFSKFDRKHYFYPDLPKGYQITQFDEPIILGGSVTVVVDGEEKQIRITRAHLEEDAGKSTHPTGKDYSLVDLNRAGTPLLEIVSEPEMHTAAEAKAYARELWLHMRYAAVSDADLYHGNMRFDVNVSVSKDVSQMGTRTETKNLNSFRSVEKAVEFEVNRQIELLEKGESVIQETRGWDDAKQKTFSQRTKEDAHDYRYFPDPDIPPVELSAEDVEAVRQEMPILPGEWRKRLSSLGLDVSQSETLIEAEAEEEEVSYLSLIDPHLSDPDLSRFIANALVNIEIPLRRDGRAVELKQELRSTFLSQTYALQRDNKLSSTNAKALLNILFTSGAQPENLEKYAEQQGLMQVSNEDEIMGIVDGILADNPKAANDVKNGEMKAIGFLVGQVMKQSKGKANPQMASDLIKKQLGL